MSSNNLPFSNEYIRLLANVLYPINITVEFRDDLDHSNFLGLQWELTHVGCVGVGIDKTDSDFNVIGKKLGSKTSQIEADGKRNGDNGTEWSHQGINVQSRKFSVIQPTEVTSYWRRIA